MKRKGPDSLEGLFIVVVTCLISTLMFGTIELSGMLFVACIQRYATDRNGASFPFMLANVLQAIIGPLAGHLSQRFSVRMVIFAGSVLSFLGVAGCYFAEDIIVVTILWGIVFGAGLGFATLPLPVVINDYFIQQRSKALGVCYVGSPIGFFIFPSVFELLVNKYGLSGSFLLLAGINMHCIPLSMLLVRPNFAARGEMSTVNPTEGKNSISTCRGKPMDVDQLEISEKSDERSRRSGVEVLQDQERCQDDPAVRNRHQCQLVYDKKGSRALYCENLQCHDGANHRENGQYPGPNNVFEYRECGQVAANFQPRVPSPETPNQHAQFSSGGTSSDDLEIGEMDKTEMQGRDCRDKGIAELGESKTEIHGRDCCDKMIVESDKSKSAIHERSCRDKAIAKLDKSDHVDPPGAPVLLKYVKTNGEVVDGTTSEKPQSVVDPIKKSMLDLYSDPVFLLICLINALTNLNFGTLSTVIIDFGRDHDVRPSHDKYIMMCISATGVVGMLGFGWVTDGGHMTRPRWASLTLAAGCACILAMPQTSGFWLLIVPLSVFCVCQSSFFPLIPAIIAECIGDEFQEVAISACNVLGGPMYFIIPPLIGYFRDGKGSYDNIFYLMAGLSIVNSMSVFVIPYLARWRDKTKT